MSASAVESALLCDDYVIKIVQYLTINEYFKSLASVSQYYYKFFSKARNKLLFIHLIQYDWNKIFLAYPEIETMIMKSNDARALNEIPKKLNNDFISLIRYNACAAWNATTSDKYLISSLNSVIKCCSFNMIHYYMKKILDLKKMDENNYHISSHRMMTHQYDQSDIIRYVPPVGNIKSYVLILTDTIQKYVLLQLNEVMLHTKLTDPYMGCAQSFFHDWFVKYYDTLNLFDISRIVTNLFQTSMIKNNYRLWSLLFSFAVQKCDCVRDEYDEKLCADMFQNMAECMIEVDDADVIEKFIREMNVNSQLIDGLEVLKTHFKDNGFGYVTMVLYGGSNAAAILQPVKAFKQKFLGILPKNFLFEVHYGPLPF
eukprot:544962_1